MEKIGINLMFGVVARIIRLASGSKLKLLRCLSKPFNQTFRKPQFIVNNTANNANDINRNMMILMIVRGIL